MKFTVNTVEKTVDVDLVTLTEITRIYNMIWEIDPENHLKYKVRGKLFDPPVTVQTTLTGTPVGNIY